MTHATPARNFALTSAAFVALSLLPCVMNAFPHHFSRAFSEHARGWSASSLTIMAAVLAAWSWAALRVGRAWLDWRAQGRSPVAGVVALAERVPAGARAIGRVALILHGPILVALFYLMWVSARLSLGRWPRYGGADDPKFIVGTSLVYWAICAWFWLGTLALALPLFRAGATLARRDGTAAKAILEFAITLALMVAAFGFILTDPHHLFTWFLD
jgi:hypothetical protein